MCLYAYTVKEKGAMFAVNRVTAAEMLNSLARPLREILEAQSGLHSTSSIPCTHPSSFTFTFTPFLTPILIHHLILPRPRPPLTHTPLYYAVPRISPHSSRSSHLPPNVFSIKPFLPCLTQLPISACFLTSRYTSALPSSPLHGPLLPIIIVLTYFLRRTNDRASILLMLTLATTFNLQRSAIPDNQTQ